MAHSNYLKELHVNSSFDDSYSFINIQIPYFFCTIICPLKGPV